MPLGLVEGAVLGKVPITGEGRSHKGRLGMLRLRTAPTSWGGAARSSLSLGSFLNHPLGIPVIPGSCCGLEWPPAQGHWVKDVPGYFSSWRAWGVWLRDFCPKLLVPIKSRTLIVVASSRASVHVFGFRGKVLPTISPQSFLRELQFCSLRRGFH